MRLLDFLIHPDYNEIMKEALEAVGLHSSEEGVQNVFSKLAGSRCSQY